MPLAVSDQAHGSAVSNLIAPSNLGPSQMVCLGTYRTKANRHAIDPLVTSYPGNIDSRV